MTCYYPIPAWYSQCRNENGKHTLVFKRDDADLMKPVYVNCGKCLGCRLDKSREWALRATHEASLYDCNSFVTLTYSDENLPENNSLQKSDVQNFFKRLRRVRCKNGNSSSRVRYLYCGEYGSSNFRPHYHCALFNCDFPDKKNFCSTKVGNIYESEELNRLWQKGFTTLADLTPESVAYIARYTLKKQVKSGDCGSRLPEYIQASNRPGIGYKFFERYKSDFYKGDFALFGKSNSKVKVPRYYDKKMELTGLSEFAKIKCRRILKQIQLVKAGKINLDELRSKEVIKRKQIERLQRSL